MRRRRRHGGLQDDAPPKKSLAFRNAFKQRRKGRARIRVPKFDLDEPDDYYTLYVVILGISEELFWYADWSFVIDVADNKQAWDAWLASEQERLADER